MTAHDIRLQGLDALDPLAFLAALGVLAASADEAARERAPAPRLRFERAGPLIPVLTSSYPDIPALVAALLRDIDRIAGRGEEEEPDPFVHFVYEKEKNTVRDLKPPPEYLRQILLNLVASARPNARRAVDWFGATMTDVAVDGKGAIKPFALHFTAGHQAFLMVAHELLYGAGKGKNPKASERHVGPDDLEVTLCGPWPGDRSLKVFSWSPRQNRSYALRARDPGDNKAGNKKQGDPGADWLALRGVRLYSSAPVRDRIVTGGVRGSWKSSTFSYPVWTMPLDVDAARSLLRHAALGQADPGSLAYRTLPRGLEILTCQISRSDQGGYGSFSPPERR